MAGAFEASLKKAGVDLTDKDWMYGDLEKECGVRVVVKSMSQDKMNADKYNLNMEAYDVRTEPAQKITQNFKRAFQINDKGGLEIFNQELYKDKEYTGDIGIGNAINNAQMKFIEKLNKEAGYEKHSMGVCACSNGEKDKDAQTIGAYLWATRGFDFKNDAEKDRVVGEFDKYCAENRVPLSEEQKKGLKEACDIATFKTSDGRSAGKDFMLSRLTWDGVYKGHLPETRTAQVMKTKAEASQAKTPAAITALKTQKSR